MSVSTTCNTNLAAALQKLGIPQEHYQSHDDFMVLPPTGDDPDWNDLIANPYNLSDFELRALKKERCGDTIPSSSTSKY